MKTILTALTTVLLILISTTSIKAEEATDTYPRIYVRQGCQYCAKVQAFLNQYSLNDKVEVIETFNNADKQKELESMFKKYNAPTSDQGVPFMVVSESEYMVGDKPIVAYFSEKYDIEVVEPEYQSSTSDTIFMVIGGALLLAVLGYGLYSVFKKN